MSSRAYTTRNVIIPPNGCRFTALSEKIGASDAPRGSLERRRWLSCSSSVNKDRAPSAVTLRALGSQLFVERSPCAHAPTFLLGPLLGGCWSGACHGHTLNTDPSPHPPKLVPLKDRPATGSDLGFFRRRTSRLVRGAAGSRRS